MRRGTWISASIQSLSINSTAKIILAEIDNLHKAKGCIAGNNHFAEILGVSTETVSRIISKLRKLGYVKQTHFDGRVRTLEPCFAFSVASQKSEESILSKSFSNQTAIQTSQKDQSRIDSLNETAYAIKPDPLYNKKQYKEEYKKDIKSDINYLDLKSNNKNQFVDRSKIIDSNSNSFPKFLEWSKSKFSGSTREILLSINSLESLLKCENRTIQIAWENWR
ncbi:MAG: helix-turn-helix domain-containing protein [Leptospiraceae bacterium]|jgi:DNA-binding Lrp family transcriptional regulator|nr:helix-turn-helix domain-containing protein [Leptospiraceae bacterium]